MAKPVEWLGNFQVNTGAAATRTQNDPHIIGLANGNILAAWTEAADGVWRGLVGERSRTAVYGWSERAFEVRYLGRDVFGFRITVPELRCRITVPVY